MKVGLDLIKESENDIIDLTKYGKVSYMLK